MPAWSEAASAILQPRPKYGGADFADKHRVIPSGTSPEDGPWRTDRNPPTREILDAICDPKIPEVYIQAASQWGKTEMILNGILYYTIQDPAPQLLVREVEKSGRSFVRERIDPMIRETPCLRGVFSETQKDPHNTIEYKEFPGGYLALGNARSMASLQSRPIRVVWMDEVDGYPAHTGSGGDPVQQAMQRTANFYNRKIVAISTPTVEGVSRINTLFLAGDQRRYHTPCLRCGTLQVIGWSQIVYRQNGEVDLDDIYAECRHCGGRMEEREKAQMSCDGVWKAENPEATTRTYQISSLLSPWVRWRELADLWVKIQARRNSLELQSYVNLKLGEVYSETTHRMADEEIHARAHGYGQQVPDGVLFVVSGVDVHDDRFEIEFLGIGEAYESWGIEYQVLLGDTQHDETWSRLYDELQRTFEGRDITYKVWAALIDTQGHRTEECHRFVAMHAAQRIYGCYGVRGFKRPLIGKSKRSNRYRVSTIPVGVDVGKKMVYDRLRLETPGPGYCHFPADQESGYDADYYKGLNSEELQDKKLRDGAIQRRWVQVREDNHPLDCRVYATAAAEVLKPDFDKLKKIADKAKGKKRSKRQMKKARAKALVGNKEEREKIMPMVMKYWTKREKDLYQKLSPDDQARYVMEREQVDEPEEELEKKLKAYKKVEDKKVAGRRVRGKIKNGD